MARAGEFGSGRAKKMWTLGQTVIHILPEVVLLPRVIIEAKGMTTRDEEAKRRCERVQKLLLLSREKFDLGEWDERQLRRLLTSDAIVRVAKGAFMAADEWYRLFPEEKLLAATLAQARRNADRGWIFTHESAAVLWQLPLWKLSSLRVQVATSAEKPARSSQRVKRRICTLGEEDVVERFGVRCTSLARTMMDLARSPNREQALSVADAGLRQLFPGASRVVPPEVDQRREILIEALSKVSGQGIRSATRIIAMADPRADSPAESVSRLHLARLGLDVAMQVPIMSHGRPKYWVDFEFQGQEVLGEVDGRVKYLNAGMRGDATVEQVVLAEKAREDEIRGLSGKRIVRWQVEHLRSARTLGERLQRFGVAVPVLGG